MDAKKGFTLVEVMVSTVIMAMMLTSLLSFVQLSAKNWQRVDQSVNLGAEGNAVMESIRYYVENSASMTPALGDVSNSPRFTFIVASGSAEANKFYIGTVSVTLQILPGSPGMLRTTTGACTTRVANTNQANFVAGAETNAYDIALNRFVGTLTEHIATLTATRLDWDSLQVYLRLESPTEGEVYGVNNATPCFEATSTFYAPLLVVTTEAPIIAAHGSSGHGHGSGGSGHGHGRRGSGGHGHGHSDIRLKHDILCLGHLANGLGVYRFRYNWDDTLFVGVMAQEVQRIRPDAVETDEDGFLLVDYDKLGIRMQTWDEWVATGSRIRTP